ncbi:MAG: hypothetical protein AB8C02_09475 [Halioglobus sp.]
MAASDNKLSTTALAKKLSIPTQQLFAILKDYEWIQRVGDSWALTSKGEFEGGSYQKSKRYGTYIVWPERLDQHPLLGSIESNQRITAAAMCRYYPRLHPRHINRSLAELGLQQHSILGWELTALGRSLGGQQEESKSSGAFYVTWPHEIIDHAVIHRELELQSDQLPAEEAVAAQDLFEQDSTEPTTHRGIDGHEVGSALQLQVCNWLYLAQLAHAYRRSLPVEDEIYADFYLPAGGVYIDCWEADAPVGEMTQRLRKREVYADLGLKSIEINSDDVASLDQILGRGLLAFGIRC